MSNEQLKPCPFCGSAAHFIRDQDEDGEFIAVACTGCGCGGGKHYPIMDDARPNAAAEWNRRRGDAPTAAAMPMESAPKDGTWIKLLIDYSGEDDARPLEDSADPGWTLGSNNFDNTEVDEWVFVGWCWQHDCIVETRAGKPIGWAPFA